MNDKVNKAKKIKDFKKFQVTSKIMNCAKTDAIFLHCLPRALKFLIRFFLEISQKFGGQALNRVYLQKVFYYIFR